MTEWLINLFRIRVTNRSIHGGLGFAMGDGVDITDRVLQFGKNPVWLSLPLYLRIETAANVYEYWPHKPYRWTQKTTI